MSSPTVSTPAPIVYAPPPFPMLHLHVLSENLMTNFPTGKWQVAVTAPEPKGENFATMSTVAKAGQLKVNFRYGSSFFPKGLSLGAEATADGKLKISPTVFYKFFKHGINTVAVTPAEGKINHTWTHDKGTFTTDFTTNAFDYFASSGSLNARLAPGVLGGFSFDYDPTRSGLKNYVLGLKYKQNHAVSYDGTGAITVSSIRTFITGRLQGFTHLSSHRKGYDAIVGVAAFSPCGAKMATKLDVMDGAAAVSVSRILAGQWRFNVAAHGNIYKQTYGGVGVSFSYEQ
eukprot:GILI01015006.1.p1 GENE.GILI01015006.1~~GILI01015006.1.p1  ORF type:complete len:287 (-),score=62.09 GILI01015006.1:163-1023(-)